MNIVLIAPPAAGKGTQSQLIKEKYNLTHISIGNLLRQTANNDDEFSKEIQEKMSKGLLISDEIILSLVKEEIKTNRGFIFDGFPRNLSQAIKFDELLKENNQSIDFIFYLNVEEEILKNRILERRVCPDCNTVYKLGALNELGNCTKCNIPFIQREDDTYETFSNRFNIYKEQTEPIINYYKNNLNFYEIDGSKDPLVIFKEIENIIGEK